MEVLQAAILDKKLMIFDEVDTGVDVDALKSIAKFLIKHKKMVHLLLSMKRSMRLRKW